MRDEIELRNEGSETKHNIHPIDHFVLEQLESRVISPNQKRTEKDRKGRTPSRY